MGGSRAVPAVRRYQGRREACKIEHLHRHDRVATQSPTGRPPRLNPGHWNVAKHPCWKQARDDGRCRADALMCRSFTAAWFVTRGALQVWWQGG
jgi:hypothetical protein